MSLLVTVQILDSTNLLENPVQIVDGIVEELEMLSEIAGVPDAEVLQNNITQLGRLLRVSLVFWWVYEGNRASLIFWWVYEGIRFH